KTTNEGAILLDLQHRDEVLESWIEKVSDYELRGLRRSKSWAQNQQVYFYIRFEQPISDFIVLSDEGKEVKSKRLSGKKLKAFVRFRLLAGNILRSKVGISGVSTDGAKMNLDREMPQWQFEQVRRQARVAWNKELSKIEIKGGTKDQQIVFYTALYHTFLVPNIFQDVNGQYRGTDSKVHQAKGFTNYSVFSLWDTYRAYHTLMTIINQKRTTDWIHTFLKQYEQGGMLPMWELGGNETFCMIGYHSVPVIVDAYKKGIRGFDAKLALKAMRSYAESNRFGLDQYQQKGYISNDHEHESVSKTLEYAFDDWCIAQLARALGQDSAYKTYIQRAQNWKNVFDPQTKHMRGKQQAMWHHPFDPREINNFFTEGNSWQYSFAVPQDIETLIQYHGGRDSFTKKLDELFTTNSQTTGRDQADVTGLIGQYAHGNEPSHHMAYLFNYVGMPWRTQELVHHIFNEFYTNAPDGLIGNEDCGQMSAWYVLSAMGFYPVNPANGEYIIGTPLFDEVIINMENGKSFAVKATRNKPGAFFVQQVQLNGKSLQRSFLLHQEILKGGTLSFLLSGEPDRNWGVAEQHKPKSVIKDCLIVPVPYFTGSTKKFKEKYQIDVRSVDPAATIHVTNQNSGKSSNGNILSESGELHAYATKNSVVSKVVKQHFYKIPSDKTIEVVSKVHPMYTADGPDALIDGITGTTNWRAGEWHSYFDSDFEAIVDLKSNRNIQELGVHVLQDVSPWILYPKEVIFYGSADGVVFKAIGSVINKEAVLLNGPHVQTMLMTVHINTRFIKVKAISGGRLPAFHESAGQPSHLFIDEIIIK
ncbi:MAG TPA: GH92 family glycosyl hydrolase, partial [Flavisolibacter sp.]|nr:GH92 family glycosyl hydrolase [Flavisolibacter sp.]